jgi:tetratricopeptide (TPR) repeat protein
MSFRDNFVNSYRLQTVGPYQMTRAQRSLEYTIDSGFRATSENLKALNRELFVTFENGIEQLSNGHSELANILQGEIRYQTDQITDAVYQGSVEIVSALAQTCDYLGQELCQIRWAIELQTRVSEAILKVLLGSLDNTSRQYWEQGVRCYDTAEYEFASERFNRSLDANRTNSFAYQYLGFIAVNDNDSNGAIKNFELARKFADTGYHRAFALSHLARCHHALGDLPGAVQAAAKATESCPENGKYWYECAVYRVRERNTSEALRCLRMAISNDIMYWSISASDGNLDPIRKHVMELLDQMREEAHDMASKRIEDLRNTLKLLDGMGIGDALPFRSNVLNTATQQLDQGMVFPYRDLLRPIREAHQDTIKFAIKVLQQQVSDNRQQIPVLATQGNHTVAKAKQATADSTKKEEEVASETRWGIGCMIPIIIILALLNYIIYPTVNVILILFLLAAFLISFKFVVKFINARGEAAEQRRAEVRTIKTTETTVAYGIVRLDEQLNELKQNQAFCEEKLKTLTEPPHGTWP